jgi:type I restriction enzyme R subunit
MYIDKPMQGHGLMQAIARVNRVFRDKPGGLVVDYLGLADSLKRALATYTQSGGKGQPSIDIPQAFAVLQEKHDVLCAMLHGFDWSAWNHAEPKKRLDLQLPARDFIYEQENGRQRWLTLVTEISRAFALCASLPEAQVLKDDIAFFQFVRSGMMKERENKTDDPDRLDAAIRQLIDKAIVAEDGVIDVFTAAGMKKPDISILSDQFLAEVRGLKYKNVAAELLEKLLGDEIRTQFKSNIVESKRLSDLLKNTLNRYHNRAIETQEVIEELIRVASEIRNAINRGEELGLTGDEIAFYDALNVNESARVLMGDKQLRVIATELCARERYDRLEPPRTGAC